MSDLISRTEIISTFTELGKTGRYGGMCEWVIEIVKQLPPAELSTNLAELGTDCISRQSAIDALRKLREEDIEDYGCEIPEGFNQDHLDRATFAINQLPSAQPKRGEWIYHIYDLFPAESTMECNQCHAEQPLTCDDEFCPHCGAKMEVTE